MTAQTPLVLMILDGWGYRGENKHNAIAAAKTPQWDEWWQQYPHCLLDASGHCVGLPDNQMGNSEVGHMHIGAGRVIQQDFTRINEAISHHDFFENPVFLNVINDLKENGGDLHVMGLLSDGGVHSHEHHLFSFLKLCHQQHFNRVVLHLFLDGRDTPPQSALQSIERLNQQLADYPVGQIASLSGRYFAMDRDKRWERIAPVYQLLTTGDCANQCTDVQTAINNYYHENKTDEFIPPTIIGEPQLIKDNDAIFFFNYRADRARQLTQAFIDDTLNGFIRIKQPRLSHFISMTQYAKNLPTEIAFPPVSMKNTLGEILANEGLSQLRIAETEKYAHVTFFFNGGVEKPFDNEERVLIPSPHVATYDLLPQMSALQLTGALVDAIESDAYDVIICNYANADMVGHTGNFAATVTAIEYLDRCMQQIGEALAAKGGSLIITADHGNAETMYDDATGQAHTAHTCELVPFVYVGTGWHIDPSIKGTLVDIAPTLLALLGIEQPCEMTGHNLLVNDHATTL